MTDERAMRFRYCLMQIEAKAERLLRNEEPDIFTALFSIREALDEADAIFAEVSREALDKVVE